MSGLSLFHLGVSFNSKRISFLLLEEGIFNRPRNILSASRSMNINMWPKVSPFWCLWHDEVSGTPIDSVPWWHAARYTFERLIRADSFCSSLTRWHKELMTELVKNFCLFKTGLSPSTSCVVWSLVPSSSESYHRASILNHHITLKNKLRYSNKVKDERRVYSKNIMVHPHHTAETYYWK